VTAVGRGPSCAESGLGGLAVLERAFYGVRVADLRYGTNVGCVAAVSGGGTPGQCSGVEEFAVLHRYEYPRPRTMRVFVCARHAESEPSAEPLTDEDRRVITARRLRRRAERAAADRPVITSD